MFWVLVAIDVVTFVAVAIVMDRAIERVHYFDLDSHVCQSYFTADWFGATYGVLRCAPKEAK